MATQLAVEEQLSSSVCEARAGISVPAPSGPIVLGLDGSSTGCGAAALALSLAREWETPLRVLSVLEPPRERRDQRTEWLREAAGERDRRTAPRQFADTADAHGVLGERELH